MQSDVQTRHDWIEFEKMPETIGAEINPFVGLELTPNANSAHIMQLGSDWETFYRAKRSSATRRHDRAKRRRMAEFGDIRFVTATDPTDARSTLETLMQQKSQSFARKGISDMFARPGYREFFLDLASNPATRHLVHVSRIEVDTTDAAANFAIVHGDCYYHILSSYCDGRLTRFGPGALHLRELMGYAIERGLNTFDFTIGDERYKSEWCDVRLQLFDYSAATTWRGWPASALSATRRRLKRYIKQTPVIWRLVSRLRAVFGTIQHSTRRIAIRTIAIERAGMRQMWRIPGDRSCHRLRPIRLVPHASGIKASSIRSNKSPISSGCRRPSMPPRAPASSSRSTASIRPIIFSIR